MSIQISVQQKPLTLTPTNVDHVYTALSSNSGQTDHKFIFDVYVDTTTSSPEKVARFKVSPNSFGRGTINLRRMIENYVEGNARSESPQYAGGSATNTGTTAYAIISNAYGISSSNAYNDNVNYSKQHHVRDYRVMFGEEYRVGDSIVEYISTASTTPASTFSAEVIGGRLYWYGAGANIPDGSSLETGVDWYYQGTSGTSTNYDGNILPNTPTPLDGYTVEIIEKYSGIQADFEYLGGLWYLAGYTYPAGGNYLPYYSPPAVTIWPGTALNQGSYNPPVYNTPYWNTTIPNEQQNFWEVKKYRMSGTTVNDQEPSLFLTTAGSELFSAAMNDIGLNTDRIRRRKHHPECPIIVSFFNGNISNNSDFSFNNPIGCLTEV